MIVTVYAVPPSPNVLRRQYRMPHAYKKLRDSWQHDLYYGIDGASRRLQWQRIIAGNVRVKLSAMLYHKKLYDPDNLIGSMKPVLDALVRVGYLKGDSANELEIGEIRQFQSSDIKTIIVMTPMEGNKP